MSDPTETSAGEAVAAELAALLPRLPRVKITPQTISQTIIDRWYGYESEYRQTIAELRTELAVATAECARVTKRAEFLDGTLDAMRQQAVEAVIERNAATERAEQAEAALAKIMQYTPGRIGEVQAGLPAQPAAIARAVYWESLHAVAAASAKRTEEELAELRAHAADEHGRLSQDLDNAEEVVRLRGELSKVAELNRELVNEAADAKTELNAACEHAQTAHDQTAELGGHVVELRARTEAAEKELAELRERIGEESVQWGVRYIAGVDGTGADCSEEEDPVDYCDDQADATRLAAQVRGGIPVWHVRGQWKVADDVQR